MPPQGSALKVAHRGTEQVWRAGGEEHGKYKQQVVEMLKAGQLVVQMLAAEETITMPDGSRKATFTQETWDMVSLTLQAMSSVNPETYHPTFHPTQAPTPTPLPPPTGFLVVLPEQFWTRLVLQS